MEEDFNIRNQQLTSKERDFENARSSRIGKNYTFKYYCQ